MQTNKSTNQAVVLLLAIITLALAVCPASGVTWSGASSVTNLWSDSSNWSPAQVPAASDVVVFTNTGSSSVASNINNAVKSSLTISNLFFNQITNTVVTAFHTTLIDTGATLTVNSTLSGTNAAILLVGGDNVGANDGITTWVTGAGTLAIGDLVSPNTNNDILVRARVLTANGGTHKAVLDMSGLNKFTFGGGRFQVACDGISSALGFPQYTNLDRAGGSVVLAKTNIITLARPRTDQFPYAISPFALAVHRYGNANNQAHTIDLGQENTINTEAMTIAGARSQYNPGGGCIMRFRAGSVNSTLKLRGADGVSRVAEIGIGDNTFPNGATTASIGTIDLSLGTVDALVDTVIVGRNNGFLSATLGANGTGTLTLGPGTFDVTTLNIGCQDGNNGCKATGTVTVRSGCTLIAGNINIGRDAGGGTFGGVATGTGVGTLTITTGTVKVSGDLTENDAPGGNGTSTVTVQSNGTLDMMPTGDTVPGNITVDTLKLGACTLANYGTLSVSNINLISPATDFTLYSGQALAPLTKGVVGTLVVNGNVGNVNLTGGTLDFDLNTPGTSDYITVPGTLTLSGVNGVDISSVNGTVAAGTYTLMTASSLVGAASNFQITGPMANSRYTFAFDTTTLPNNVNLTVSGSTSNLTWSGDGTANLWNLKTATNWDSQTEAFYNLDSATFDDSSTNQLVNLSGTLQPGSVTVAGTKNYTFAGSGKLSGAGGLTMNGSGTLTLNTANDFSGAVYINSGTLLVNGALGNSPVTNTSGTLGGTGTILGPVNILSGGTLSPGASIGTLAISNNLVLAGATVFEANMTTLAQDKIIGLNSVAYGGTLSLVLSGRSVVSTDSFKLFYATTVANPTLVYSPYSGTFSSILPATPGPDMVWYTNTLATDGTLRITSTTAPNVSSQVAGNRLSIAWPPDHLGWHLQAQTNTPAGLTATWFDVPNTSGITNFTTTINPANGSVFYRLVYP